MNYVMSDIHGDYEKYIQMLKKICFRDEDNLYILGDVIDRGDDGLKILQDMLMRPNVFPIIGNHEYIMAHCMDFLLKEITEESVNAVDADTLQGLTEWMNVGGSTTIEKFSRLDRESREDIVDYLSEFSLMEELSINKNTFILVHAGLVNFDKNRSLESYDISELIFKPPHYNEIYFEDKYLITGHLPTRVIWAQEESGKLTSELDKKEYRDEIFIKNNHIAIDCGCGYGGVLGCICLENFKTYYV